MIESERARVLDPLSLIIAADNAMILHYARDYERAAKKLEAVLEHEPAFPGAHKVRHVYVEQGRFDEALEDILSFSPDTTLWDLAYTLARAGRAAEAAIALARLMEVHERRPIDPIYLARVHAAMGDIEQALAWLEQGRAQRCNGMVTLKVDPAWDPLRAEPRFQELLGVVGLAD